MSQLFSPRADRLLRTFGIIGAAALVLAATVAFALSRSAGTWGLGTPAAQPIPFSHAIHAGQIGLDCRYCHAGVERTAQAGMPTAETCLGCHSQVWNVSAQFAPLETALSLGRPVTWSSVHRLPEHVRFQHAAHIGAGVTCAQCHGPVETMARTVKTETQSMAWCLDCHRDSTPQAPALVAATHAQFGVAVPPLANCSTCHR
ncbi:cytochrome c3 family protein [Falsiroseomonas sp.]|uniref:cytochrome c3 family protein n=1 Tax=Falsiroseomonas sp. TaxID=2870721 RepID=UPI003F6E4D8C